MLDSKRYTNWAKRLFDLAVAIPSVLILSPFLVLIGIFVQMRIGSPLFFRQTRPGLHGRPFTIYKFRTMTDKRDEDGNLMPDGKRLTSLGRFLRKTSMDPQITRVKYASLVPRNLTRQAQIFAD